MATRSERSQTWAALRPFVLGGISGCFAISCIQPIDLIKVRIQLQGEQGTRVISNPVRVGAQIVRSEGVLALYRGLSAALLRQATYGTTRLGLFRTLTTRFSDSEGNLEFSARIAASLVAGGTAALVGTPADAALVRIQSDTTLPVQSRRGYRNVFDALLRMLREEGLKGMFSGASPAMLRGLTLNMGMLATYDPTKDALTPILGKGIGANLGAATVSGTCAAIFSLPFDFIKTRLQKQIRGLDGQFTYSGIIDCFAKVSRREGLLALYNGFFTYCLRIAPNIMITWMTLEYLNSIESLK